MNVLQLAPLWFPVSRNSSGGIETILAGLIEVLQQRGCRNTLFASGESQTAADELVPIVTPCVCEQMAQGLIWDQSFAAEQHLLRLALERAGEYDVIHSHLGWGGYILSALPGISGRVLHTQHNPVYQDLEWFLRLHPDMWFTVVSEYQARKFRRQGVTRCRVIPNGIDVAAFTFQPEGGDGLFFLGRMEPDKGPDLALAVARELGLPLTLAGPMLDEEFFARAIAPYLNDRCRYLGVVNHEQKNELFGRAGCVLMCSRVEEGFGMVSIEAMACGTPVVALASGALPEVIEPGLTGYLAEDVPALPALVRRALRLDRAAIRARVRTRYDIAVGGEQYHRLYEEISRSHAERGNEERLP
jgi:glycosyltransferase involved in cell wall biosynthesis